MSKKLVICECGVCGINGIYYPSSIYRKACDEFSEKTIIFIVHPLHEVNLWKEDTINLKKNISQSGLLVYCLE